MATLLVFNSSSKVAFGDLSQARPWNWCNLKSGCRIAARAQIPMTSGIRCPTMKNWGRVEVWEAFVQYCRNRLVTVKAIEEKNDDIIRISIKRPDWSNIFAFYQEKKSFSANVPHLIFCQKKCRHAKCIILATAKLAQNKNLGNVSETFSCWFSGIYVIVVKDFLLIDEDEEKSLKYATDKSFRKSLKDFSL